MLNAEHDNPAGQASAQASSGSVSMSHPLQDNMEPSDSSDTSVTANDNQDADTSSPASSRDTVQVQSAITQHEEISPPKTQFISPHAVEQGPAVPLPRSRRRVNAPEPKSILKPPTAPQARFSWKRDFLQPVSTRLAYAAANASAAVPSAESQAAAGGGLALGPSATGGTGAAIGSAAAGFWGSALRKLSGVTAAAAGVHPADDGNSTANGSASGGIQQHITSDSDSLSLDGSTTAGADVVASTARPRSLDGPAPHTPAARGTATSSVAASSPYATIKAAVPPSHSPSAGPPPLSVSELKRVRFRVAAIKVVYPINSPDGSIAPYEEGLTRRRVNVEQRNKLKQLTQGPDETKGWTGETLAKLYFECCRTREERAIPRLSRLLKDNLKAPPRVIDLSNEVLTHGAVEALSDLLSVDFGLKKLVLEGCGLDDESLRPLLHALLVSGNIPTISLANNKRIKSRGWKYLAIFIRKARFLKYLDLSENSIDKRAADHLVLALTPHSLGPSVIATGEANGTREKDQGELSRIAKHSSENEAHTADTANEADEDEEEDLPLFSSAPLLVRDDGAPEASKVLSIRLENCNLRGSALEALAHGVRASSLKHISIRRNRINALGAVSLAIMIRDYPLSKEPVDVDAETIVSASTSPVFTRLSASNSVTARQTLQASYLNRSASPRASSPMREDHQTEAQNHQSDDVSSISEARLMLRKQIDELPRTGSLLTLDVKANDIRNGVLYIAQVLKRNRTLKVLNLSENKIDSQGLVAIADALKTNASLETLDMSLNPCCGPSLEGIMALRNAIVVNSNLKRIFLNSTDLSSEGAIALAEFLPESKSLLHLDLTGNYDIDIAGALALSVSVKMNTTLRCLDLNIPPNDPDFARLSQEILQCCIRNTEQAQEDAVSGGKKVTIAAPILKSVVARDLKELQIAQERQARRREQQNKNKDAILSAAEEIRDVLRDILALDEEAKRNGVIVAPSEIVRDTLVSAQLADAQLAEAVAATRHGAQKDRALRLGDDLTALLDKAKALYDTPVSPVTQRRLDDNADDSNTLDPQRLSPIPREPDAPDDAMSSPGFTIADSDDDDDEELSQPGSTSSSPTPTANGENRSRSKMPHLEIPESAMCDEDSPRSPMESQSRSLTLEEGEVFRKGAVLGTGEVDEDDDEGKGDVSGEELKKEILETRVERSPRTSFSHGAEAPRPVVENE